MHSEEFILLELKLKKMVLRGSLIQLKPSWSQLISFLSFSQLHLLSLKQRTLLKTVNSSFLSESMKQLTLAQSLLCIAFSSITLKLAPY